MGKGKETISKWRKSTRQYKVLQNLPEFTSPGFIKWQKDTDTHTIISWEPDIPKQTAAAWYRRGSSEQKKYKQKAGVYVNKAGLRK